MLILFSVEITNSAHRLRSERESERFIWLLPEFPLSVIVAFVMETMASVRRYRWHCLKANLRSCYARPVAGQACLLHRNQIAQGINGIRVAAGLTFLILMGGCSTHKPSVSSRQAPLPITNRL